MKVVKVFNNNVVAVKLSDETEAIVTGSGVGFKKKPYDEINIGRIQNVYMIEKEKRNKLYRLLENTSYEYIEIAEEILEKVKKELYPSINDLGLFGLVDHISFAIERARNNIELPNLILKETKLLYKKEYEIALWALSLIYKKTGVVLPEDEAGYIVIHILNASGVSTKDDALNTIDMIKEVVKILEEEFQVHINEDDFEYYRLVMHLKCIVKRIIDNKKSNFDNIEKLYDSLINEDEKIKNCIEKIDKYIERYYKLTLDKSEKVYLAIHINRIVN